MSAAVRVVRRLVGLVVLCTSTLGAAAVNFTFESAPGPLPVGFRVVEQYDRSRVFLGDHDLDTGRPITRERARPIQTLVWYPATDSGQAMRYGDYLRLTGSETDFTRGSAAVQAAADAFIALNYAPPGANMQQLREELAAPMRARRDAAAIGGKFPIVIYAPSISAPAAENPDLCEYLASHGYIVIASPSIGPRSRRMPNDLAGAEAQAADISFLIGYAGTLAQADPARIAVAGFSWGGFANVLAAARDSRIKALVALDGSVRYYPELVSAATYLAPQRTTTPMLYVAARPSSLEDIAARGKPTSSYLNDAKHADMFKLTMYPMEHFAFSSTYLRFAGDEWFNQYSRIDANQAHGWTASYVGRFLDAYLKDDEAALAYLDATPARNGFPAHAATMEVRRAAPLPPGREQLAAELARRDFQHAGAAYRAMFGREKDGGLPEKELNAWGYALLQAGEAEAALAVFGLTTELYASSANAFDSLGEACERSGDTARAIINYRRSLELNPDNDNARQRLQALENDMHKLAILQ